ncbi:MAG: N-(5'-phosphoribosyl)anthranilate isomerase [Cytophagales bacterium]|nr:N-(5'-phosphoribosyl)anthranilate isomerase [Cytophagales bacterium]
MALSSFVYLSDVENLSDARYAAGMGVDLLGFRLDPHDESSLSSEQFQEIAEWISGIKIVGEFGRASSKEVEKLLKAYKVDYILVEDAHLVQAFSMLGIPLILKLKVHMDDHIKATLNYCSGQVDFFLLESDKDLLEDSDVEVLRQISHGFPIILGYGITDENAAKIACDLHLRGISLKGSPELRPGYKDFDELADILEALEID